MKHNMYAVFDERARIFLKPFSSPCRGPERHDEVIRAFSDIVSDARSPISQHPHDYVLYFLGDFDDETGRFVSLDILLLLARGSEFVKEQLSAARKD